ncbi:hypothetical protein K474DRAFT_1666925 [Panus rudis PR-1116 ss-1]|nr:hypothetical protein K474DRAFT_1666925 [Panus rudis PR-1116 ss-1]
MENTSKQASLKPVQNLQKSVALADDIDEDLADLPPPRPQRVRLDQTIGDARNSDDPMPMQFTYPPESPRDTNDRDWLEQMFDEVTEEKEGLSMHLQAASNTVQRLSGQATLLEGELKRQARLLEQVLVSLRDISGDHITQVIIDEIDLQLRKTRSSGQTDERKPIQYDELAEALGRVLEEHVGQCRSAEPEQRTSIHFNRERPRHPQEEDPNEFPDTRPRLGPDTSSVGQSIPISETNASQPYTGRISGSGGVLASSGTNGHGESHTQFYKIKPVQVDTFNSHDSILERVHHNILQSTSEDSSNALHLQQCVEATEPFSPPYIPRSPTPIPEHMVSPRARRRDPDDLWLSDSAASSPRYNPCSQASDRSVGPPYFPLEESLAIPNQSPQWDSTDVVDASNEPPAPVTPEAQIISVDYSDAHEMELNLSLRSHGRLPMSTPATRSPPRLRRRPVGLITPGDESRRARRRKF